MENKTCWLCKGEGLLQSGEECLCVTSPLWNQVVAGSTLDEAVDRRMERTWPGYMHDTVIYPSNGTVNINTSKLSPNTTVTVSKSAGSYDTISTNVYGNAVFTVHDPMRAKSLGEQLAEAEYEAELWES